MQEENKQLQEVAQHFLKQKPRIPKEIAWKLQYMLDFIHKKAKSIQSLTQQQRSEIKDLDDLNPQAIKVIFISIVNSILSPNLYCSFEKNCKIKLQGPIHRWVKVYTTFDEHEICFKNRKKILKFVIEGLQCFKTSDLQLQFKYKGVRKLKIRFQHPDAARNMDAKVNELIEEHKIKKKKQSGEEQILSSKAFQQSLKTDYIPNYKSNQNTFVVHKSQPKIHAIIFMQGHFWDIGELSEFISTQKLWNNKVKQQKFIDKNNHILVERRWKGSSLLSLQRRTFTRLTLKQVNQTCYIMEQHNETGTPTSRSIIISDIYLKIMLDILSPKIIKLTLDCSFNARGYCNKSNSRSMLIDLFSDIVFLQDRYQKLRAKGKLHLQLSLNQKIIPTDRYLKLQKLYTQPTENKIIQDSISHKLNQNTQAYFSIVANKNNLQDEIIHQNQIKQQQFYDMQDCFDNELESFSSSNIYQKNGQQEQRQEVQKADNLQIQSNHSENKENSIQDNVENLSQQFQRLRPKKYDQIISVEYVKLIKQKINEKIYLKKIFKEDQLKYMNADVPWYDPSIIIPNGKQYRVSDKNELIFINYDLIRGQKDSLIFIIKQVGANLISGKSVLSVSLPVDIFQSRSLLERSAASFGCAPKYLSPVANSGVLEQMKAVVGFMLSVAPLELVMLKPFNPILGQTFQAYVGQIPIYYEQISHHPPISSYYMTCGQFTLYGNLEAIANVSLNSGAGGNAGKMHIIMRNGNHFQISFFPAQILGLIYGSRKYSICRKAFVMERNHHLVAEISVQKDSKGLYQWKQFNKIPTPGDIIGGIFKVKNKFLIQNPPHKSMLYHPGLKKCDIQSRLQTISGIWFSNIFIGGQIINTNKTAYPIQYYDALLPSDSNYRIDILMHRLGDLARSQSYKEILENIQRNDRKLREKGTNQKKKQN